MAIKKKKIYMKNAKKRTKYYFLTLDFPCKYLHKSSESVKSKGHTCAAL